jgi:hypothetical protein
MAGGLWQRKFNYTTGDTRNCKLCGKEFHTMRPLWKCPECYKKWYNSRPKKHVAKTPYPYDTTSQKDRIHFTEIRQRLRKAWDEGREALTKHYDDVLNEIEGNGIAEWIWDRRDDETLRRNKGKRQTTIKKDLPDTRQMNE